MRNLSTYVGKKVKYVDINGKSHEGELQRYGQTYSVKTGDEESDFIPIASRGPNRVVRDRKNEQENGLWRLVQQPRRSNAKRFKGDSPYVKLRYFVDGGFELR